MIVGHVAIVNIQLEFPVHVMVQAQHRGREVCTEGIHAPSHLCKVVNPRLHDIYIWCLAGNQETQQQHLPLITPAAKCLHYMVAEGQLCPEIVWQCRVGSQLANQTDTGLPSHIVCRSYSYTVTPVPQLSLPLYFWPSEV